MKKYLFFLLLLLIIGLESITQSLEWVTSYDKAKYARVLDITSDSEGNIYSTGYFDAYVDFDPGPDELILQPAGSMDIYLQKLDPNGNLHWAFGFGSWEYDAGLSLCIDEEDNIYLAGRFNGSIDFDPGEETFYLNSNGESDAYIIKMNPNGNLLWAKSFGSETGYECCNGICVDNEGNILSTGYFRDTVDFDPGTTVYNLSSVGFNDAFILKLDSEGNFIWVKNIGGTSWDKGTSIYSDPQGNIYTTGQFKGTMDVELVSSQITLTSSGDRDVYIVKQNSIGDFQFAVSMGGVEEDLSYSIIVDDNENVYSSGYFQETADFDPGVGVENFTSNGGMDFYIQKLDPSGNYIWAHTFGKSSEDHAFEVALDEYNNVYSAGYFHYTVDFDPGADEFKLTSSEYGSAFILKLDPDGQFVYALATEGPSSEIARTIHVSKVGIMYVSGDFQGTVDFDPGPNIQNLTGSVDGCAYIQKFNYLNSIANIAGSCDFKLISNPVNEILELSFDKPIRDILIIITSMEGSKLFEREFHYLQNPKIDVSKLSSGFYLISVINHGEVNTLKFIKE